MDRVQQNLYKMLIEVDRICKKHKIEYYLGGGSALGAVRGNAFLPWDDDIDIYITRNNYRKLCGVIQAELPEGRSFITQENTPLHYNPIGMYVDDTTTCIIKSRLPAGKACGQVIEFLVLDPLPVDKKKADEYKKMMLIYTELLSPYLLLASNVISRDSYWDQSLYEKYYKKAKQKGKNTVLKEIEDRYLTHSDEECKTYCMRWGQRILLFEKEDLGNARDELFEERMFPVAEHAERIFRMAYGDDWMYVPEWQEQIVHDAVKDLDICYSEFLKISERFTDKEKLLKAYCRYKEKRMKWRPLREQTEKDTALARAKAAEMTVPGEIDMPTADLWELLEKNSYTELERILKPYFDAVFMPNIKRFSIHIAVDDELIEIALRTLIGQGKYSLAKNILKRRMQAKKKLSKGLREVEEIIRFCHDISVAQYDERNPEEAGKYLQNAKKSYRTLNEYMRCRLWVLAEKNGVLDETVITYAKDALDRYPDDGEIRKYTADILWEKGLKKEAESEYRQAASHTRNGIVWLDIFKKTGIHTECG